LSLSKDIVNIWLATIIQTNVNIPLSWWIRRRALSVCWLLRRWHSLLQFLESFQIETKIQSLVRPWFWCSYFFKVGMDVWKDWNRLIVNIEANLYCFYFLLFPRWKNINSLENINWISKLKKKMYLTRITT
jgi:hypothetical protein